MKATTSADGTAALDKALDVLDAIGAAPQGLAQAELAARLGLPRTTLYRLLAALVARGLLRRDPLRRVYCLGLRCFEYARAAYAMPDLVAAAGLELRTLRDLTGETAYLAVLDGREVLSLERVDGAHGHRSQAALGQRKPLHCTSQGKAILAALPAAERQAIVRELALAPLTPHTLTERRRLQAELKRTAERGWSIDDEEIALGVRCVGAAIVDGAGRVRGALSVAGPAFRLTRERVELLGPELAQAARRVGAQLDATRGRGAGDAAVVAIDGERAFAGDFARWSARDGCLYWADRLAPAVHRHRPGSADRVLAGTESPIEALLLHARGPLVAQGGGWWRIDPASGDAEPLAGVLPRRRLQAWCTRPDGTPWACSGDGERFVLGALAGAGATLRAGWHLPEPAGALAWSGDGRTLYASGPASGTVYAMRDGSAAVRRLASVPKGSGRLAGLAVDAAGGVWAALHGGWSVVRFGADGAVDRVVGLPVPAPAGLAFGGRDGRTLYVTSSRDGLAIDALAAAPLSGRLFAVGAGVAGVVDAEAAG